MKLTKLQIKMVNHRLEAWDAMAECLEDTYFDDGIPYPYEISEICKAANNIADKITQPFEWDDFSKLECELMQDAFDGGTYTDIIKDCVDCETDPDTGRPYTRQKYQAVVRAYEALDDLRDTIPGAR